MRLPTLLSPLSEPFSRLAGDLKYDRQPMLWIYALLLGIISGLAAVGFWYLMETIQGVIFGSDKFHRFTNANPIKWWVLWSMPILGGVLVGLLLHFFSDNGRPQSVSHVIEACKLRQGQMSFKQGIVSATASVLSLGFGASTGREGPVVHLGATISSIAAKYLKLNPNEKRTLLAAAAAAAVSASFNAPIAGALFALEVILGHYAVSAFAPIVIASAAGTVISRTLMGDFLAFNIPEHSLSSYSELPAFAILGLVCAATATLMMVFIIIADDFTDQMQNKYQLPAWLEPVIGGALLGSLALITPQILGVGYETILSTLHENHGIDMMIGLIIAKSLAVAISLASRFGGGVFSPSLMLGVLTGGVFGIIATGISPDMSDSYGLYALAGMGAVSAAVLGAPISTILIIFELTQSYDALIAVMISVSLATVVTQRLIERSYFHWRLGRRGLHLGDGPHRYIPQTISVCSLMRPRGAEDFGSETQAWDLIEQGVVLEEGMSLSDALPLFHTNQLTFIPIVTRTEAGGATLIGTLFHIDALRAFNRALILADEEEHA